MDNKNENNIDSSDAETPTMTPPPNSECAVQIADVDPFNEEIFCQSHTPNTVACETRLKLIKKGIYVKEKYNWKKAHDRIIKNLLTRDADELKVFIEATFKIHEKTKDKCKHAHAIHCAVANHLSFRQSFFGFYTSRLEK